jgi:hypothetical protein
MDTKTIIENFYKEKTISQEVIYAIDTDNQLRIDLINYFRQNKDRDFVLHLLDLLVSLRKYPAKVSGESIMLACYILGLHNQIEDCLKIWNAKTVDFDAYCYVDIQLMPFAGVNETIEFLKKQEAKGIVTYGALQYILECKECGDFDELNEYFSKDNMPWFV